MDNEVNIFQLSSIKLDFINRADPIVVIYHEMNHFNLVSKAQFSKAHTPITTNLGPRDILQYRIFIESPIVVCVKVKIANTWQRTK